MTSKSCSSSCRWYVGMRASDAAAAPVASFDPATEDVGDVPVGPASSLDAARAPRRTGARRRQIFDALAFAGAVPESDAACLWTVAGRRTDAPGPEDARARFASDIAAPHGSVIVLPRHPPGGWSL